MKSSRKGSGLLYGGICTVFTGFAVMTVAPAYVAAEDKKQPSATEAWEVSQSTVEWTGSGIGLGGAVLMLAGLCQFYREDKQEAERARAAKSAIQKPLEPKP